MTTIIKIYLQLLKDWKAFHSNKLQIIFNWNSLSLELKATADPTEFDQLLKQKFISQYSHETDCPDNCFSCNDI